MTQDFFAGEGICRILLKVAYMLSDLEVVVVILNSDIVTAV